MENKDVNYWCKKAAEFYKKGNFEEAIKSCVEILKLDPNNVSAIYNKGNAIYNLALLKQDERLFREAIENFGRVTRLMPSDANAYFSLGNALFTLGMLKQNELLLIKSFENFEKAIHYDSNNVICYRNWGDALLFLAQIKQDESLFRESFEKYGKMIQLGFNDAITYNKWGIALSELAQIRQDESLFYESFEKYAKAIQLDSGNAGFFYNWGIALSNLAQINRSALLFCESIEKYKKATQLDLNHELAYNNWGNVLLCLAQIKQDETLFKESFEKYSEATKLNPYYASAFDNWGVSLFNLAMVKQDESLFRESFEKFTEAIRLNPNSADAYCNFGEALFKLYQITKDENLAIESAKKYEKSKKNLLNILVSLHEDDREQIAQTEIFYSLLDSDTNDGIFFKETIKNIKISQEELNKYKKIYINSILIISKLHVSDKYINNKYANTKYEKLIAHYQHKTISQTLLFENTQSREVSKFRLSAINYSNDPTEGITLLEYLFNGEKQLKREKLSTGYGVFAGCFTFNYDSLNQFRLYGKENEKEGTGLSLVFNENFFNKELKMPFEKPKTDDNKFLREISDKKNALFRCMYIDPETQRVETIGHKENYLFYREGKNKETEEEIFNKIKEYNGYLAVILNSIRNKMEKLKVLVQDLDTTIIGQLLITLRYLTKHIAFKEEQECRIIKILQLDDKNIQTSENFKQLYVNYLKPPSYIEKIYFGPKATGIELFQDILTHNRLEIPCEKSKNPLT